MAIYHFTQHEKASVDMFCHLLEKNQEVQDEFESCNLSTVEHGKFVAELIMGEPDESSPQVSMLASQPLFISQSQCTIS